LDYLPTALKGILDQSFTNFELIIVNDGSTDNTMNYLDTLTDPRIKIIHQDNKGLPAALNTGFSIATGEFRTWTSADNFTAPTWLEQLTASLNGAPKTIGFASSGFALINAEGDILGVRRGQKLCLDYLTSKNVGITSFLYRASIAEAVGGYDEKLLGAEDWDMWLRILEICDAIYVDDVLYYYRQHSNSMTGHIPEKVALASLAALEKMRQRHGGQFNLDIFYPNLRRAEDAKTARWQAMARLASVLVDSPYCPITWTFELLDQALKEQYSPQLHHNLIILLCLHGGWNLAIQQLDADNHSSSTVSPATENNYRSMIINHDPNLYKQFPIYHVPDQELVFALARDET
jgi:glycosyltransferase involved in cell wall biosynthesis